MYSRRWISW
uniref:Uncharacterized protein n=1 Tax=Arundo donax TaxID=35708 RepID=A0A0A9FBN3_ARUDO